MLKFDKIISKVIKIDNQLSLRLEWKT